MGTTTALTAGSILLALACLIAATIGCSWLHADFAAMPQLEPVATRAAVDTPASKTDDLLSGSVVRFA